MDVRAGGTWLGLNDAGLFVAITNRYTGAAPDPERRSRGDLVTRALGTADALSAARDIEALDGASYNGFHLLIADSTHLAIVWGDGQRMRRHLPRPGSIVHLTERSFGAAPSARELLLTRRLSLLSAGPEPNLDTLGSLLATHADPPEPPTEGLCVHMGPYATCSSTRLRLASDGAIHFSYTDGAPCVSPWVDASPMAHRLLGG